MANTNVTIANSGQTTLGAMNFPPLGCNTKWTIPYTLVATGTGSTDTVTVALGNTPAKWVINSAYAVVTTAFAGTTAFSITVGTTTTTNAMIASADLIAGGAKLYPPASGVPVSTNLSGTSALALVATFTNATGGSPSAVTAGQVDIYANVVDLSDLG
mgnify:CR=1 FL=1